MGQVWLAEQIEPVNRQVALKLIKAGMYDAATVQRFKAERQSLAIMDHPAIAKVFDAGTTPVGQPYLVMEYVDGLSITDYCDAKRLSIRKRLQLFIRVCEGVQHPHQKAIIHRDLKPSNILVVEVDGKPTPRIIDFGLAKALAPLAPGDTLFTQMGAFLGTPGYMSPEQADPEVQDIDTRTDVYSLGAILYELLTRFLPFEAAGWKNRRPEEFLRQLREEDPLRPSTKISANRQTSTAYADARATGSKQLVTSLRGDLELDHHEGDRKRSREKVRDTVGPGNGHPELFVESACHGSRSESRVPGAQICAETCGRSGRGERRGRITHCVFGHAGNRTTPDHARARPRGPYHRVHDQHVQGVEP